MLNVDTAAFLKDLHDLRKIGTFKTGVHRPTFSPQDMESRRWLKAKMEEAGLEATIDGIGNVFGRHKGPGPHVLAGSHIETQNEAGWLDGALGVVSALHLARAGLPVDVCAFADEEGHFSGGFIGSRSITGDFSEADMDESTNRYTGKSLREALREVGLDGVPRVQIDPARYKGFFEMHIEQGTQLENAGLQIGVVTGIVAIWQWQLNITGQQDHAGGTTMAERKDAGLTAVRLLSAIDAEFPRVCGERSTWTTGNIRLSPGAASIIPGTAEVLFQFRDVSMEKLEAMEATLRRLVQESNRRERCRTELVEVHKATPAICDPGTMRALQGAAEALAPGKWQDMPSGAGHDAQNIAKVMPASMLFVPSIGGVSHHWAEDTKDEDLAMGMRVLAEGVSRYLAGSN